MKKMIAGLAAGIVLGLAGAASAESLNNQGYDVNMNVNGNPFYGKWAIVDDRPFVGIEALSDALGVPRKSYYKSWDLSSEAKEVGDPLMLMAQAEDTPLKTIRFNGVTMVDLYAVASALDLPVHHNFRNKTIQVGSNYTGEEMKGKWYRYLSRARGYRTNYDFDRFKPGYQSEYHGRDFEDSPKSRKRF